MSDDHNSAARSRVRAGLELLVIAAALSPLLFVLEAVMPSRENTRLDELPQLLLSAGLMALATAGVARIAWAFVRERGVAEKNGKSMNRPKAEALPRERFDERSAGTRDDASQRQHTPV